MTRVAEHQVNPIRGSQPSFCSPQAWPLTHALRIHSLTTKASEQASASLRFANAQVAAHTAQMEARRKAAAR